MILRIIPSGPFEANCLFVTDEKGSTLVTDPGADAEQLENELVRNRLDVAAYLITHGHADHIGALHDLWQKRPAPILIHPADAEWAFSKANELLPYYPAPRRPGGPFPKVEDGSVFSFGDLSFRIIATPGHSPGCVCYYFEKDGLLITGDTLFQGSAGRTDLPGGDSRVLADSLVKLAELPESVRIVAGHGDETTLGAEIRSNYFMQGAVKALARRKKNQAR
ncbi:MAG: MBL fold metallo-hydrolase [Kiritimatiellia bacterium]